MASESTEESAVTVSLGPELEEWLDERARDLGVDREAVLVRILTSSREAAAIDDAADVEGLAAEVADSEAMQEALGNAVDDALDDREPDTDALEATFADRLETVRADFREKLDDVRDRVVQVKRETDGKAPAAHTHQELERVDAIETRVADMEAGLADVEAELSDLAATVEETSGEAADLDATVTEVQERLKTVAWVVSDLREAYENPSGTAALERLKHSAARADASRARCERCGEGVEIALLTEPECPHCEATVTEVAPASGFFGKPQLLAASQLESGDDR